MKKAILIITLFMSAFFGVSHADIHETAPYDFTISKEVISPFIIYKIDSSNSKNDVAWRKVDSREFYHLGIGNRFWLCMSVLLESNDKGILQDISSLLASNIKSFPDYDNGAVIHVDGDGIETGMIDGREATTADPKFSIYDGNKLSGIAYLDNQKERVNIYYPEDKTRKIAKLKRVTATDTRDKWIVHVVHPEEINYGMIRIFAAYIIDIQSQFRGDDVSIPPLEEEDLIFGEEGIRD